MAVNAFQTGEFNANLFSGGTTPVSGVYASEVALVPDNINASLSRYTKIMGIYPTALLNTTTGYPAGGGGNDSWAQPNGSGGGYSYRPGGGYFARGVWVTDQNAPSSSYVSYGYVGSLVGGWNRLDYTHDYNPGPITGSQTMAVDYEPPYGHGALVSIAVAPLNWSYLTSNQNQWRDSANLTQDPTAQLTLTGSNYSRTAYAQPAHFVAQIDSATNTIGSGNVRFHVEMRPTFNMTAYGGSTGSNGTPPYGSRCPMRQDWYGNPTGLSGWPSVNVSPFSGPPADLYFMTNDRRFGSRALSIFMGRIFDGQGQCFAYPHYEDQTAATFTFSTSDYGFGDLVYSSTAIASAPTSRPPAITAVWAPNTAYALNAEIIDRNGHVQKATTPGTSSTSTYPAFSTSGGTAADGAVLVWTDQGIYTASTYQTDNRIRHQAYMTINDEYFLMVQETKFAIFSSKTVYPLIFLDLLDQWNSGTWAAGYRIGGAIPWNETTAWQASHTYAVGDSILDSNGNIQVVTAITTGISGSGPSWNTTYNGTTPDGGVTWTNYGANKSKIYFIAENGSLALFDSNVANSSVTALASAPALSSGQAYGALAIVPGSSKVYAVTGCFGTNPTATSTDSGGTPGFVGVTPYDPVANTWGSASFPAFHARHNARSLREVTTLRNGSLAFLVERVNVAGSSVSNAASGGDVIDWQVMLYAPSTSTWNTNQIYGDGTTNFSYGTPTGSGTNAPISYENAYNCSLYDVAAGPSILVQSNWRDDKLFVIDGSQPLGTISNSNVTNVSRGAANDLFAGTTAPASASPLQIRKSVTDDRTMFWFNEAFAFTSTNGTDSVNVTFFLAPPSWTLANWTTGPLQTVNRNTKDNNGNIQYVDKDKAFLGDVCNHQGSTDQWSFLGTFTDNAINVIIQGGIDANSGQGEYYITSTTSRTFGHNSWQATFYMPTYFKWNGSAFVMADNYADAAASPAPVPASPGTNINLPYGIVVQFGTTTSSSFGLNEWFTINLAWGNTKYVRKARYTWAMFAGQTFQTTQTLIPMSAVNAVIPSVILAEAFGPSNVTISNTATGLTQQVDGYITCANWPIVSAGSPQNVPTTITMTVSHPDPATILNRPWQTGQAYNASTQGSTAPASNAFSGCPINVSSNAFTGINAAGGLWLATGGANSWIAIDLGSAQTANSYMFNQALPTANASGNNSLTGWTLYGSNTASDFTSGPGGTATAIDTRTGITPTRTWASNISSPGSYRYYILKVTTASFSTAGLGFFRLFSGSMQTTMNFCEITSLGPNFPGVTSTSMAPIFQRGMKFEISTNGGSTYTTITPIWRSHMGGIWCFPRQTAVTNVRITVQSGYTYWTAGSPTATSNLAVGPFQFVDYNVADVNSARLGNNAAADGTPTRGSYDSQFIGIACDAISASIDTTVTPGSLGQQITGTDAYTNLSPVWGWWTFTQVPPGSNSTFPNGYIRVHPVYGYILFGGPQPNTLSISGGSDQSPSLSASTANVSGNTVTLSGNAGPMSGTDLAVSYHWGRRVQ